MAATRAAAPWEALVEAIDGGAILAPITRPRPPGSAEAEWATGDAEGMPDRLAATPTAVAALELAASRLRDGTLRLPTPGPFASPAAALAAVLVALLSEDGPRASSAS